MQFQHYLNLLHRAELALASAFREVAGAHDDEVDVSLTCRRLATQSDAHAERLAPFLARYADHDGAGTGGEPGHADGEPARLHHKLFSGTRTGPLALLRDLHDLYLMACECDITWTLVGQAAQGARDEELLALVQASEGETTIQSAWLRTRMKAAAAQSLIVA